MTGLTPADSALFSNDTSHVELLDRSNLKTDSQMTPARCQQAMVSGEVGPASVSSVLSFDGTLQFEGSDSSALGTDLQMTFAKSQEEAVCRRTARDLDYSILPLDGTSNLRLKTAESTQTFNMFSDHCSDEDL